MLAVVFLMLRKANALVIAMFGLRDFMTTLILDKTLILLSDIIAALQTEEDDYWDNEYLNSLENHYSRYGF